MTIWNGKEREVMLKNNDTEVYDTEHSEQIFIDNFINKNNVVQIFLLGGMRIVGTIVGSDDYTILVKRHKEGCLQMIYKTAITTISLMEVK